MSELSKFSRRRVLPGSFSQLPRLTKPLPSLWEQSATDVLKQMMDVNPSYLIKEMSRYGAFRSAARKAARQQSGEHPPLNFEGTLIDAEDPVQLCVVDGGRLLSSRPVGLDDVQERVSIALLWLLRQEALSFQQAEVDPLGCLVVHTCRDGLWSAYLAAMRHVYENGDGPRAVRGVDVDQESVTRGNEWRDCERFVVERMEAEGLRTTLSKDAYMWSVGGLEEEVAAHFDEDVASVFDAGAFSDPRVSFRPARGVYPRARFVFAL